MTRARRSRELPGVLFDHSVVFVFVFVFVFAVVIVFVVAFALAAQAPHAQHR
ncbi:hypothetical protein [Embleya sp. AB8]|uniref:hypothetical protein n=1 Tax=Embleya sp. AB8 TaxID=3156304 RepID=UPI003C74A4A6